MKSPPNPTQSRITRRAVLKGLSFAPLLFKAAPMLGSRIAVGPTGDNGDFSLADFRLKPHYPSESPLADIFRLVPPGSDEYPLEKPAVEIEGVLRNWGKALRSSTTSIGTIASAIAAEVDVSDLGHSRETAVRSGFGIEVYQRTFGPRAQIGRERLIQELAAWLKPTVAVETAEFEIYGIEQTNAEPFAVRVRVRYDIVGRLSEERREERVGSWEMEWSQDPDRGWLAKSWHFGEESQCLVDGPAFADVTARAFAGVPSYNSQLLHGADYWRTVLDGAVGVDVYGNNGIAAGDFDGDGFDDLYICQPAGLPNRLYRNRGDGTFEDVTQKAGVGVLDSTACALFADFLNRGLQDLLVVCGTGPLLFLNNGNGAFALKRDAFKFARPPQGSFTHAAVADYDNDGRLDVYFCLYMYYLGLEQYNYPVPYYDARNGPPNCLFHNQGDGTFVETTEASGLNADNNRYSFACAWGDSTGEGRPDLFVANDFGSSQLYRNNGDGTFKAVSSEAHIESVGAGMSCCWADYDNDGHQDIYVPSMWEAAGQRVSQQPQFHQNAPDKIRGLYQRHARGNVLYRNRADGTFEDAGHKAGVEMGRWSWSSDFWDWDHDGFSDLLVSNGYLSEPDNNELAGFFWRQVVAKSPEEATPLAAYERGWNAINELIRGDNTWHGQARNVAFVNNGNGTFTEASGALLLDFREDGRAFALADLDHDGRLEVILKNRNAPQLRVLHNMIGKIGAVISFRLRGTRSNRDGIGTRITVTAGGSTQTKYLQAGSGFLSQHAKELFFGLGAHQGSVHATVRWPSGVTQEFASLPAGHRIEIEEASPQFRASAFNPLRTGQEQEPSLPVQTLPREVETWLIQPLKAPGFRLADSDGVQHTLEEMRGGNTLIVFWSSAASQSIEQLRQLSHESLSSLKVLAINMDEAAAILECRKIASQLGGSFPYLFSTAEFAAIYNILYRHLFDRRRDLPIPSSLLLDGDGMIVKIYQGKVEAARAIADSRVIPADNQARMRVALPFPGQLIQSESFGRNDFTYGVALYQHGFLDQAAESFEQVIASKPDNADAYYNLGTLNLRRNHADQARKYLEKTIALRPTFAEAWNNLGMLAAQQGNPEEAVRDFQQSISIRPSYFTAHLNLGNLYRRQHEFDKANDSLEHALALRPDDPEVQYSLGMLSAQQSKFDRAAEYLERAIALRPDYPEALNNLGVLYVRRQDYAKAEDKFQTSIKVAPGFDQSYMNLARLYAMQNNKQKARDVIEQLLRLQPDNANAKQAMEVLQ